MMPPRNNDISRHTILLASSKSQSILAEVSRGEASAVSYSAYGHLLSDHLLSTRLGFNGELREPHTGWYMLGNGYRAYNPLLMRFHSPDKLSPFGAGGLNAYMYCVGDPINYRDPTGRIALPIFFSQLSGVAGAASSLGGMISSLYNGVRFSRQGLLALGTGTTGVFLGAAVIAAPASVIAPVLAVGSAGAGVATLKLARRAANVAAAVVDPPPSYFMTLLPDVNLPRYSRTIASDLPPPYTPSSSQLTAPPTHSTAATALSPTAPSHHPQLLTAHMGDLPQVEVINEIKTAAQKIRSTKR
ncbi:RHS repeat-associated core domain-containing protein [Pseudomonas sp. GL-RE-29]|uniref:RHS repeat-associated core domain-containing protein n=1 Tax=Pseudomonas sp. GL-RE-29 TaxID=2832375 RepID=UPI002958336F|nr:RHS repeat-associated core domain-containing protein [Pseudomonas sp. GL-RE-29]